MMGLVGYSVIHMHRTDVEGVCRMYFQRVRQNQAPAFTGAMSCGSPVSVPHFDTSRGNPPKLLPRQAHAPPRLSTALCLLHAHGPAVHGLCSRPDSLRHCALLHGPQLLACRTAVVGVSVKSLAKEVMTSAITERDIANIR